MALKYECLILDHDDTAVDSTATVHYPAHVQAMRVLRPGVAPIDLRGWFLKNFHPGLMGYLTGELGLSEQEMETEYEIWRAFTTRRTPQFFPGFLEALSDYRSQGGKLAVVSHSERDVILSHYRSAQPGCDQPLLPDLIFGWETDEQKRKPSPWPVFEILKAFDLPGVRALIVDDLKPGIEMSQKAQVPAAGVGWAHRIPEVREYMQRHCLAYFDEVAEFRKFILG